MIIDGPAPVAPYPRRHREFGERLRQARLALPMALRKFAAETGYSPTAVSQVEQGAIAELDSVALAMCVRLKIPQTELLAVSAIQPGDIVAFDKIKNSRGYPLTGEVVNRNDDGTVAVRTWGYIGPGAELDIQDVPLAEVRLV